MGKATVISHNGSGLYTVTYHRNNEYLDRLVAALEAQIINLEINDIPILVLNVSTAEANVNQARAVFDAALAAYNADKSAENKEALDQAVKDLTYHGTEKRRFEDELEEAQAQLLGGRKRWEELRALRPENETVQAWCADLVETIPAGTVVSITELSGVQDNGVNIHPAFAGLHIYNASLDGDNYHGESQSPEAFYYNTAMRPGWQKYVAKYRSGIIDVKYGNGTFDVILDSVESAATTQAIEVNSIGGGTGDFLLSGISALYMDCDEKAFDEGDHVIVLIQYTDFGLPTQTRTETIIGFVDSPKPCGDSAFAYMPVWYNPTQNIDPWQIVANDSGAWLMTTPYTSDLITERGNTISFLEVIRDWKGFLNDGTPMVAQWIPITASSGADQWLFVNGVKTARVPTRTFAPAAGDTTSSTTADGFEVAWITRDNAYIYAIVSIFQNSIHLCRKTTAIELTGGDYDAGTLPDGWEYITLGLSDYTYIGDTGIGEIYGGVKFAANEDGNDIRGMVDMVHGAGRTPPVSPDPNGVGATWATGFDSTDVWPEELQINIANPFAASLSSAGVTLSENGVITDATNGLFAKNTNVESYSKFTGLVDIGGTERYEFWDFVSNSYNEFIGGYAIDVGFVKNNVNYLWINGKGVQGENYVRHQTIGEDTSGFTYYPLKTSVRTNYDDTDWGYWYEDNFGKLSIPLDTYGAEEVLYEDYEVVEADATSYESCKLERTVTILNRNYYLHLYNLNDETYFINAEWNRERNYSRWTACPDVSPNGEKLVDSGGGSVFEDHDAGVINFNGVEIFSGDYTVTDEFPGTWTASTTVNAPTTETHPTRNASSPDPYYAQGPTGGTETYINNTGSNYPVPTVSITNRFSQGTAAARSHYSQFIAYYIHSYNATATGERASYLSGQPGGLDDLDEITGDNYTEWHYPHVVY